MDEVTQEVKKTWGQLIPRKIIGGIVAMWLLGKAAVDLKDVPRFEFTVTIGCMAALGALAIWTHYLLERKPKPDRIQNTVVRRQNEYHPDIPDEEQKPVA